MRLQGNIDAAVNGGVSKYRKAFFTPEFRAANPSEEALVESLASQIEDQANGNGLARENSPIGPVTICPAIGLLLARNPKAARQAYPQCEKKSGKDISHLRPPFRC